MTFLPPIPKNKILRKIVPTLEQMLRGQAPLTAKQRQTINHIKAIASQLTKDGRATAGQVIDQIIPLSGVKSDQQQSKTTALLRAKNDINALFAKAGMDIVFFIDRQNKLGNKRPVWFYASEPQPLSKEPQCNASITALDKTTVISALALVLKNIPDGARPPLRTLHDVYAIAATLSPQNSTTAGAAYNLYKQQGGGSPASYNQRLWTARTTINRLFEQYDVPVAMMLEENFSSGKRRTLYFVKTAEGSVPHINKKLIPQDSKHATKLFRSFVSEIRPLKPYSEHRKSAKKSCCVP